jgi:acetyltransferase-like isoleucine patch superfamily enzyme
VAAVRRAIGLLTGQYRVSPLRTLAASGPGRRILAGRRFTVRGASRVATDGGRLELGLLRQDFTHPRDVGLLHVRGRLVVHGNVRLGRGNRWDIAAAAQVQVGAETYFSAGVQLVSSTAVTVGAHCAIGWETQFLDDDFHELAVGGRERPRTAGITVGDRVWIGSRCTLLKGTSVAPGCVVASNSVVSGVFSEPGCLIAGNPARVVRTDVSWR